MNKRIYLSPPHMSGQELELIQEAFDSNWIAPLGPHVDAFEKEFADYLSVPDAAALSSGTAALHLAIRMLEIGQGDEVICPSFTFCATANAAIYEGATPVLIDSEKKSWNLDPDLLEQELLECSRKGKLPKAVITVDLYGQCSDYQPILEICARYDIPVIEDAAEALGATYDGKQAGTLGAISVFSFNGNKIITTSTGGMLVAQDTAYTRKARFLATQARDPAPHYQHSTIGYNYRMSNILAAIGRAQLAVLPERIEARRSNYQVYSDALGSLPGVQFMPEVDYGRCTRWLTCLTIDPQEFGMSREEVRLALEAENIEARPTWKPLHLQPVFKKYRMRSRGISEMIFENGLCLPSGSNLSASELTRIIDIILESRKKKLE